ncbi:MAG: metallophosphoesterase [Lachnospiraceae bacterium]|nr:metallophosphoesterase [Lachnospiraceae bacterium]
MKKRFLLLGMLLILTLSGCGKQEAPVQDQEISSEKEMSKEEAVPPAPGEENWGTAPEFSAPLITTTPIRYLSVTVGSTEKEVNLTWFSPSEEAGQVYWTTADDVNFENAFVYSTTAVPSEVTEGYYVNKVTVTGLEPETEYLYQAGSEEALSPAYTYTTPAFSDTFRFTAVGDAQIGKPVEEVDKQKGNWHKLLNKVKYHFPDTSFLVSLGDQINDFDDREQYNAFLNQGALYSLSLAPLKGNHEMGGPQFSEHFSFPNQSKLGTCDDEGDGNYWFTRGNALFIALNTMDSNKWGEHYDFIASAVEANPDTNWRIVFSHYSPYNGYEGYLENAANIRPYFLKFTSDFDIDLVLCGHDHAYVRTSFIQEDGSFTEYDSPAVSPEGTMYVTLSSSSGSMYRRPVAQDEAVVSKKRDTPEVTDVQITPTSLTISTYNAKTWELTDTFEIQK